MLKKTLLVTVLLIFMTSAGYADEGKKAQSASPAPREASAEGAKQGASEEKLSITRHSMKIDDRTLSYTATAGCLPLKDESGKTKANMFFISYVKDQQGETAGRPITFAFNGGPGASSMWVNLGALGPLRAPVEGTEQPPAAPYSPVNNEYSWLAFTDLVFIDPVGTGFSRPASGENARQFYGIKEDTQSVGDFIRLYTTRFGRWLSPKFLAGESYGTYRAVALTEYLYENYGMDFNGIVLISLALNFQTFSPDPGNDLPYFLYVPTYAASARHHKKLAPELREDFQKTLDQSEAWAMHDYVAALAAGASLPAAQRTEIIEKLSSFTGISKSYIENHHERIPRSGFMSELLRPEGRTLGLMDSRATGFGGHGNVLTDPGLALTVTPYAAAMNNIIRNDLKYETDVPYIYLSMEANSQWNWGPGGHGYVNISDTLREAMNATKHLKVFVACGLFDLDTPYLAAKYTMNHLGLDASLQGNIVMGYYEGGHQLYTDEPALKKLTADVAAFMKSAIPK